MHKLRIHFCDFWPEWKDENFILPILKKYYNVSLDQKNPDILFFSIFGNSHTKFKCKKILFIAENIRNNYNQTIRDNINLAFNGANYTISFDPANNKNYRLPLWQVYILLKPEIKERLFNKIKLKIEEFKKFCSFTVSNSSNMFRNYMFYSLSQYKSINSYGRFLTNDFSLQKLSKDRYWRDAKDEFFLKNPHKFSIAYENTKYPYYCTEKLMDAFLCGSMPIYDGSNKIGEEFNENSFINVGKLGAEKSIELIKEMDINNDLFYKYYNEPIFTEEQKNKLENNLNNFESWLINII